MSITGEGVYHNSYCWGGVFLKWPYYLGTCDASRCLAKSSYQNGWYNISDGKTTVGSRMISMDITSGMISMDAPLPATTSKAKKAAAKPLNLRLGGGATHSNLAPPPSRHHDASQVERAPCDIQNHASLGLRWNDWKLDDISPKTSSPNSWGLGIWNPSNYT